MERQGPLGEAGHSGRALIGVDLQLGDLGAVVDGGLEVVIAQTTLGSGAAPAGPAMDPVAAAIRDATLLLHVQVDQLPRLLALVADHLAGGAIQLTQ